MKPDGLTDIQETYLVKILPLLARGWTDKDIAELLYLHPRSVARHIAIYQKKIGAKNRFQLAVFAMRRGDIR